MILINVIMMEANVETLFLNKYKYSRIIFVILVMTKIRGIQCRVPFMSKHAFIKRVFIPLGRI